MLLIDNIGCLFTGDYINDAAVLVLGDRIFWAGAKKDLPQVLVTEKIDAQNKVVIPGLIDCHSHLLFYGQRADEFALRMKKESYSSIMAKGGGIASTVASSKAASDQELFDLAKKRADQIIAQGVTTLEAKSGYGLSFAEEIRALKILKKLDQSHQIDIHPTFLAHLVPKNAANRSAYILEVMATLVEVAQKKLAMDCDVFCEDGAFSFDEALKILNHADGLKLGLRAHVQQLGFSGGIKLLNHLPIKSLSHADFLSDEDLIILAKSSAVVEILPFACLFLRSKSITPAEKLKNLGVKLAIATDFNPGSAMCHDLILAARLGITMFELDVEDVLSAITLNAAQALGRTDIGGLKPGMLADLVITNCPSINEIFYDWTKSPVQMVIKRGRKVTSVS